jgi:hypothetical protein
MRNKKRGDIDADYHAIRSRLKALGSGSIVVAPLPPHGHAASDITFVPAGNLAGDDVQEVLEEIDVEKLARDGSQEMLGSLDMDHHNVNNVLNLEVEGDVNMTGATGNINMAGGVGAANISYVRQILMNGIGVINQVQQIFMVGLGRIDFTACAIADAIVSGLRVLHMTGVDVNSEGRIDGLERTVFNLVPTAGVIQDPSVVQFNPGVAQFTDQPVQEGSVGWDTLEETLVVSNEISDDPSTVIDRYPVGWVIFRCQEETGEGGGE